MSGLSVSTHHLDYRFGSTAALQNVELELGAGRIHGLLGRNGAGKTTLLSVIAAMLRPSAGAVLVGGKPVFEHEAVTDQVCLVRAAGDFPNDEKIRETLRVHETIRPTFNRKRAEALLDEFGVSPRRHPNKLSLGQRSAVGIALGLASQAQLTMFDEVHLGLDVPSRQRFYDLLLADFAESGRTYILSTHLISEVEHLFETVTILDRGRVLLSGESDDVRSQGITITGPAELVADATHGLTIVGERKLGPTRQVTVFDVGTSGRIAELESAGLTVAAAPLEDLFTHLTDRTSRIEGRAA